MTDTKILNKWIRKLKTYKVKGIRSKIDYTFYFALMDGTSCYFKLNNSHQLDYSLFFFSNYEDIIFFVVEYMKGSSKTKITFNNEVKFFDEPVKVYEQLENDPDLFYYYKWNGTALTFSFFVKTHSSFLSMDDKVQFVK